MGCGNSVEDQVLLAKLDRLEVQVKKEKDDKLRRIKMTKDFQKKLYSRIKAKQYINRIVKETHSYLHERGIYKTPDANDFYTDLLPDLQNIADNQFKYSFTNRV